MENQFNKQTIENILAAQKSLKPGEKIELTSDGKVLKTWISGGKRHTFNLQKVFNVNEIVSLSVKPWVNSFGSGLKRFSDFGNKPYNNSDQNFDNQKCEMIKAFLEMIPQEVKKSVLTDTYGITYNTIQYKDLVVYFDINSGKMKKASKGDEVFYYKEVEVLEKHLHCICENCREFFPESQAKLYNLAAGIQKILCNNCIKNYPDATEVIIK